MRDGAKAVSPSRSAEDPQPNHWAEGSKPAPGLYLVATPIGNLDDITFRAIKTLQAADLVACEDTRTTGKLLTLLGLKAKAMTPYHEHNADAARPGLLARLAEGAVIALVSDAGTPLLSDPGYRLVRDCAAAGHTVTSVPGASAALPALQLSALPCDRFLFAGFLPPKDSARRTAIGGLAAVPATLVFYESPRRLADTLADLAAVLGDRPAAVARELTKLHEEVRRDSLARLAGHYRTHGAPKGEVVVVVGPPAETTAGAADVDKLLREALATSSPRDAAALVAAATSLPKRDIYRRAVAIAGEIAEQT